MGVIVELTADDEDTGRTGDGDAAVRRTDTVLPIEGVGDGVNRLGGPVERLALELRGVDGDGDGADERLLLELRIALEEPEAATAGFLDEVASIGVPLAAAAAR